MLNLKTIFFKFFKKFRIFKKKFRCVIVTVLIEVNTYSLFISKVETDFKKALEQGLLQDVIYHTEMKTQLDDPGKRMPIFFATSKGQWEIVKYLVEKGVDLNATGNKPLHRVLSDIETSDVIQELDENRKLKLMKYLIENGANVNAKSASGKTILHLASQKGYLEIVKYLVDEKSVDLNVQDKFGSTCLHIASKCGHLEIVRYLVDKEGVDLNLQDIKGLTCLHMASERGYLGIVKCLVNKEGMDLNVQDLFGYTCLHFASERGHLEIVTYLTENLADVKAKTSSGSTSPNLAAVKGQWKILKYFFEAIGDNIGPDFFEGCLLAATTQDNFEMVKFICDQEECYNAKGQEAQSCSVQVTLENLKIFFWSH